MTLSLQVKLLNERLTELEQRVKSLEKTEECLALTPMEIVALRLIGLGMDQNEIAREMRIKPKTVRTYRNLLNRKLRTDGRPAILIMHAYRLGLVETEVLDERVEPILGRADLHL